MQKLEAYYVLSFYFSCDYGVEERLHFQQGIDERKSRQGTLKGVKNGARDCFT
jgi:hypothetical protein